MNTLHRLLLLILISCFILGCSNGITHGGGGTTETVGVIVSPNGDPAPNVRVRFVPSSFNPQSDIKQLDSTHSGSDGTFSFMTLSDGEYNIMYEKDGLLAFRRSVVVTDGEVSDDIQDTLKESGSIRGVVTLLPEHDNRETFILVKGSNRFVSPYDEVGNFIIDSLAEGLYDITILTKYPNYGYIDTLFSVEAGIADTIPDTLKVPYVGLETPKNFVITYDSLLQRSRVEWSSVESSEINGYYLYRYKYGDTTQFKVFRVSDTFFIDSCNGIDILQDSSYSYQIASVDKAGRCGIPSELIDIQYETSFSLDKSTYLGELNRDNYGGILSDGKGTLFAVCSDTALLFVLDEESLGIRKTYTLPDNCKPYDIDMMADNTLMISGDKGCYNLDRQGEMLWRYNVLSPQIETVNSKILYFLDTNSATSSNNAISLLNVEDGMRSTYYKGDERAILSFVIYENYIYIAFDVMGYVSIECSPLRRYTPDVLYTGGQSFDAVDIVVTENEMLLLAGANFTTINRKTMGKTGHTIVENARYITSGGDHYSLLNYDGSVQRLINRTKTEYLNHKHKGF